MKNLIIVREKRQKCAEAKLRARKKNNNKRLPPNDLDYSKIYDRRAVRTMYKVLVSARMYKVCVLTCTYKEKRLQLLISFWTRVIFEHFFFTIRLQFISHYLNDTTIPGDFVRL